ncbi:hypothetical protein N0B40_08355 [Chryseobacterium oranimense]|uniref:hypothetical protein n=1 Tax=Chryseobacterium oranimense TaxID=421058 RepID=UPI0021B04CA2|nr:hypothetical protein [Chryseobacterium oranimense]UWX62291.1 hypothetical protein N0B40_08355 [Chryseobacterium oranimense]
MKNLRNNKLSREQLKGINGSGIIIGGNCSNECCPTDGRPRCPRLICPAVICPQYL